MPSLYSICNFPCRPRGNCTVQREYNVNIYFSISIFFLVSVSRINCTSKMRLRWLAGCFFDRIKEADNTSSLYDFNGMIPGFSNYCIYITIYESAKCILSHISSSLWLWVKSSTWGRLLWEYQSLIDYHYCLALAFWLLVKCMSFVWVAFDFVFHFYHTSFSYSLIVLWPLIAPPMIKRRIRSAFA